MTAGRAGRPWLAILAIAAVFAIKLAALLQLGNHPLLVPSADSDGAFDVHFAEAVARGDVWLAKSDSFFGRPPVPFFTPPLYIYVLAGCLKLFGRSLEAAKFVQILLGTAAVWLVALTARRWFGDRAAWFAGALAALCGIFTFYEVLILHSALDPFLSALDLYLLVRASEDGRARAWALAGAALGLHALNQAPVAFILIGIAIVLAVRALRARGRVAAVLAFTVAGLAVISPATIRNWRAAHEFVFIKSGAGLDVLIGNGPEADGTLTTAAGVAPVVTSRWLDAPRIAHDALGHDATTSEQSRVFLRMALGWIRDHPGAELGLIVRKLRYAFSATYITSNYSYPFFTRDVRGPQSWLIVGPALFVPLGVLGLVILAQQRRERTSGPPAWPLVSYAMLAVVPLVMLFVRARIRVPLHMALIVAAGGAVAWLVDRFARREWATLGICVGTTAALAVLVAWPTGADDGRTQAQVMMGLQDIRTGQRAQGEAWIQRAIVRGANPVLAHLSAGQVYEGVNLPDEAMGHYRQALAISPNDSSAHYAVGQSLLADGKDQEAIVELERARGGEARDNATQLLVLALARQHRTDEVNRLIHSVDPSRWTADQARGFALALADAGRVDLSLAAWMRAADVSGDAHDYERLGLCWAIVGRPAEAVTALEHAVRIDPASATIRLNYGVALATVGRVDEARREADVALTLDPSSEKTRRFIEAIRKK